MKIAQYIKGFATALTILLGTCAAQAQGTGLSYGGYSVGYMNLSRTGMADTSGVAFSGSFQINDNFFAAAEVAALSSMNRGRVGLGFRYPIAKTADAFVIAGAARNTNFDNGWGNAFSVGANMLIAPSWQAQLMSTNTNLNSVPGHEQETSVSLGYSMTKDLVLRARALKSTNANGYELSIGSKF
jgi:hypothetical protein